MRKYEGKSVSALPQASSLLWLDWGNKREPISSQVKIFRIWWLIDIRLVRRISPQRMLDKCTTDRSNKVRVWRSSCIVSGGVNWAADSDTHRLAFVAPEGVLVVIAGETDRLIVVRNEGAFTHWSTTFDAAETVFVPLLRLVTDFLGTFNHRTS